MKRVGVFILALLFCVNFTVPVFGQASRIQIPTQYGGSPIGSPLSFRGGGQTTFGEKYQRGMPQTAQPPSLGGTAMGAMGEAGAMMASGYQVHILGEVSQPGTYVVTASTRLLEAVQRAGGFLPNASERNVELRRKGGGTVHVDLLEFKLMGKLNNNPYLMDNDVIFVPLRGKVIQVTGAVKRPDIYELKNEKNLEDVLELAGGFNPGAALGEPLRVIRFENGEKVVDEIPLEKGALVKFAIANGDVVIVPNITTKGTQFDYNIAAIPGDQVFYPSYEDRVFVLGGVAAPGAYPFSPYYTVNQYVSLAGGISDRGSPKFKVTSMDGKTHKARGDGKINPGDTIMIQEHWMSPASWIGFVMGMASFGLSTATTVLALTNR